MNGPPNPFDVVIGAFGAATLIAILLVAQANTDRRAPTEAAQITPSLERSN